MVGYARVSTDLQTNDGQIDALNAAGCELMFKEPMSGTRAGRPQLANGLADKLRLRVGADFVRSSMMMRSAQWPSTAPSEPTEMYSQALIAAQFNNPFVAHSDRSQGSWIAARPAGEPSGKRAGACYCRR